MALAITIDGIDRRASIPLDSVEINDVLTRQTNIARFVVQEAAGFGIDELDTVVIQHSDGTRHFGGFVETMDERESANGVGLDYAITCVDFSWLLDHPDELINRGFDGQTDQAMIQAFMPDSCPEIEVSTYVQNLRTHSGEVLFPRMTPREVIERLADIAGGDYYVDYGPTATGGANLVLNPGFEDFVGTANDGNTDDFANWTETTSGTSTVEASTNRHAGSYSLLLTYSSAGTYASAHQDIAVTAGREYELTFYTRGDGSRPGMYAIRDQTNGRALLENFTGVTANSWTAVTVAFYVPGDCTTIRLRFQTPAIWPVPTGFCGFDAVDLKLTTTDLAHLRYFDRLTHDAPFDLSDAPNMSATYPYERLHVNTRAPSANVVDIIGGPYIAAERYYYMAGDGAQKRFDLEHRLRAPTGESAIQVWVWDVGTSAWVAKTVGAKYIHDDELGTTYDVLYSYSEKFLEFDTAPPNVDPAVRVYARPEIPILTRYRDQASHTAYGRWIATVLEDKTIRNYDMAQARADALFAEEAMAQPRATFVVRQSGLRSGQQIDITSSNRGLTAETYLIQRVRTTFEAGGEVVVSHVEAGLYDADLVDLLLRIRQAEKARFREVDNIHGLVEIEEDVAAAVDSVVVTDLLV